MNLLFKKKSIKKESQGRRICSSNVICGALKPYGLVYVGLFTYSRIVSEGPKLSNLWLTLRLCKQRVKPKVEL